MGKRYAFIKARNIYVVDVLIEVESQLTKARPPRLLPRLYFAFYSLDNCRRFRSCKSTRLQQSSTRFNAEPQTVQYQSITINKILQISTRSGIWFGPRCST